MIIKQVLESIAFTFTAISLLVSVITVILIFVYVRPLTTNVPILLACNTYAAVIGSSTTVLIVMIYGVLDTNDPSTSFNDLSCQIRSYVMFVFACAFFYSCVLQAIFRLFRVVFSRYKILQTRAVLIVAVCIQWLVAILYMAVYLLRGDFEYHSEIGNCWFSFKNIPVLGSAIVFTYAAPLTVTIVIYGCIIRHIRGTIQTEQIRQQANKRDLLIVKRMIILVLISMLKGVPAGVILLIYIISNYLCAWAYHIQLAAATFALLIESVVLGLITPQVREILEKTRQQINPVAVEQRLAEQRADPIGTVM